MTEDDIDDENGHEEGDFFWKRISEAERCEEEGKRDVEPHLDGEGSDRAV